MRILVTGGGGRLANRLIPALVAAGHVVVAPLRTELDAADGIAVLERLQSAPFDLVIALAAYTEVGRSERVPLKAFRGNVQTAEATTAAAARLDIPVLYVSSDYVFDGFSDAPYETTAPRVPRTVYGKSKAAAEDAVLRYRYGMVARVAFLCPEDALSYTWLNGYTRSSREWVGETAERIVRLLERGLFVVGQDRVRHLVPPDRSVTVAQLVAERMPQHPALQHVLKDASWLANHLGYEPLPDTRLVSTEPS